MSVPVTGSECAGCGGVQVDRFAPQYDNINNIYRLSRKISETTQLCSQLRNSGTENCAYRHSVQIEQGNVFEHFSLSFSYL